MPAVLLLVALGYLLLYAFATPHESVSAVSTVPAPLPDSSWMMNMQIIDMVLLESTARHVISEYMHHVSAG